jgi:integrase
MTKRDFVAYQNWLLNENGNSPARARRLRSTLSSWGNYIENILDDVYPDYRSIVKKIEPPAAVATREKTVLSDEQLQMLLDTLVECRQFQKACAVALAAFGGARKSELVRYKVSYFTDENIIYGSLYKTPEKVVTKGRGKHGALKYKYTIVSQFKPYLDLWLEQRKELGIKDDWLFMTKRKDINDGDWSPCKSDTLNSWALTCTKILGVDFYFHCLRHFFTTSLAKQNIPDSVIQEIVGWASIDMVRKYDDTEADEKFGKYFDENGIKTVESTKLSDL